MHILISLFVLFAVMAGVVVLLTLGGLAIAGSAGRAAAEGPMKSGLVPRVAFILLWVLIFGISLGLIGAA